MGYAGYFLIVADFVRFAREQRIATTCRGSAPGSIVTYTLGITPVDPILYALPFERFLNPDRVTMPDIDVDFEDSRRDEVIAYVTRKYGSDHVAQIITFGTMLARAAIRDVGRVLGLGYGEVDRIAKAVPNQLGIKLEEALQIAPPLKEMYDTDGTVHRLIDLARQVEGVARNASTHAAGVVISREPLTELMPLQKATNSEALMTQYEMHGVEALGLLKFDFLGLSNLTILRQAVDLIAEQTGEPRIDLDRIPLDDAKTFELLSSGETTGVFQLESAGMRRYIRELRPTSVYDLAAMVALFRPGPMDNIPAYIRRKHGQEAVTYLHPLLEPYLEKTYGIFVYQEDIMAAAIALGGFTGPEADTLGYAIRKKKSDVLQAQRGKFVSQAAERGVPAATIDAVFKAFEPFERYGFNKAHATCYGLIAYQTAYLKANYPVEYMTAVLTAFRDNTDKVAGAVAECRRLGIAVLPPDIHASGLHFTVEGEAIRFGLLAIKNVGQGAIESMVAARETDGDFRSLADLCCPGGPAARQQAGARVAGQGGCHVRVRAPGPAAAGARRCHRLRPGGAARPDLGPGLAVRGPRRGRGSLERPLPPATEAPSRERSRWEKELLGLYLSDHPLGDLAAEMGAFVNAWSSDITEELDQQRVVLGGVVTGPAQGHHPRAPDHGRRDHRGPAGLDRGHRVPQDLRGDGDRPGWTMPCSWSPGGSTTRATRPCSWPTRCGPGSRHRHWGPMASGPRSRPGTGDDEGAPTGTAAGAGTVVRTGTAVGHAGNGREAPGRQRRARSRYRRTRARRSPSGRSRSRWPSSHWSGPCPWYRRCVVEV